MFKGKKTYMAAGGIVLGSIAGYLTGDMSWQSSLITGLNGLALMFLRQSIPKI